MEGLELFNGEHSWNPFEFLGFHSDLLKINIDTVFNTWIVLIFLTTFLLLCRFFMDKSTVLTYMVHSFITSFMDLTIQSLGSFNYHHFVFVSSIFIFILLCNWIALIPFVEEPTKDLNTTLALGCISFFIKNFMQSKFMVSLLI